ncbi:MULTISPECIES: LysR family transcriptional regulator [unclassified Duganella]|uniref:LysR family transcriptional regulator n=1 Tax=unclassified Duganella TaxID=2636909 RepID=UPI000881AD8D|nr:MULTISPECIES: LysR family transcriptional regulator [unclassified Duganella]SDF60989.1 LysR family transcriptional regulator, regulator for bpeEF and oprC [Duganella sp. OV458]SDI67730.1 LysR family transcriptional regulator, regulator for bpeEF and oprC [Duganella sp. OV510]
MNKLQAMEVFVQVVDAGGFTRAAENMKLPKATVSTLIQALETSLAVKLLHRTTRHVSVTADGAAYYERCLRILSDVREAEESLSRTRLSPSGRLRVDAPTGLASEVIVPALPDFFQRYPDIQLELGCSDRPVDLVEEGVDCAVRGGTLGDSSLIARRVGILHFTTGASPAYLARYGRPAHPNDLLRHRCVNYFSARTGKIFDWDFTRDGERVQVALPGHIALNDSNAYIAAGAAGLGIVQMATFMMEPMINDGRFEMILGDWVSDPLPVHVVYPQNRHLSAKVRVFVEWVAELFSNHPGMRLPKTPARAPSFEVAI